VSNHPKQQHVRSLRGQLCAEVPLSVPLRLRCHRPVLLERFDLLELSGLPAQLEQLAELGWLALLERFVQLEQLKLFGLLEVAVEPEQLALLPARSVQHVLLV